MEKNRKLKMKGLLITVSVTLGLWIAGYAPAKACDACKAQQPKFLQGITHGPGPTGNWDYIIVGIMVVITLYSVYALIKCLAKPENTEHLAIKKIILNS